MKDIKQYITESQKFKLAPDERYALSNLLGVLCGDMGDDEDIKELESISKELSKEELEQLSNLFDCLEDDRTYKTITQFTIEDDIPLIKKIYKLMNDNDMLNHQWDLIDAFEKICEND